MFNLEWYRIFLHTARLGNLTKAAEALYITQPSVSYAIKQMEEALGLKLFRRLSKGVELTPEGKSLLDYVERSFSLLSEGEKRLQDLKQLAAGELRVGASDSLFKILLLPKLDAFHSRYPDIRIRLSHGKTPEIAQRLKDGLIDCGLVHMPLTDPQLDVRPFAELPCAFVAGRTYAELADRPISAAELGGLPLLLLSQGSSTRRFVETWFAAQGVAVDADIELGSIDLLVECARLGLGIAFVARPVIEKELEAGDLIELKPITGIPPRQIGIATLKHAALPLSAESFLHMLATSGTS
ncbi:LysR family transcriptional regulator [Paenibacillus hamazuiensis]|uniref:LysR family transcriptional regulator n=1 Tax=Paenibacillus hamazuiensis TaxID=2936508 RepID=UPI00200C0E0D